MPAIFAPWPAVKALAIGFDDTPTSLTPPEYFKTGMNMILNPHGIYVQKVEAVLYEKMFSHLIRGLTFEEYRRVSENRKSFTVIPHRYKYFAFMIDLKSFNRVEVRQAQLKDAINNILKAYGKRYL